jgi:hypothetical protein
LFIRSERGFDMQTAQEIREEIASRLAANPETGEQWAEICALENRAIELERNSHVAEPLRQLLNAFTPLVR